jgi:DNA-binding MarR family transcriptional regulator
MDFRKLCSALRLLETQGGDARIADAQTIAILMDGPTTYEDLGSQLALSNSAVSRTIKRLSAINRKGKPGFGLVTVERDPREGRRYVALLSQKGRVFLDGIGVF